AYRGPAVFGRRHNVHVLKAAFADDSLVGHTVERDTSGITKIVAWTEVAGPTHKMNESTLERRLDRSCQHFIFSCTRGPAFVMLKFGRHIVLVLEFIVFDLEESVRGNTRLAIGSKAHHFSCFH